MKKVWREWKGIILFALFGITVIILLNYFDVIDRIDVKALSKYVKSLGFLGEVLYVAAYTIRPFFFFPATAMTLFGGYTFGAVKGTMLDVIGAGSGAVLAFFLSRYLGRRKLERWVKGKKIEKFDQSIKRNGFLVVLYLRLIPLFPFDSLNYSLGLSSVRRRDYIFATYLGIIPGSFVLNFLGSSFKEMGNRLWIAAVLYGLLIVIPIILKKRKKTSDISMKSNESSVRES